MWTRLNEIATLIEDCPHSTAKDEGSGYPLIRTPNVGVGRLLLEGVHRVSKDVYDKRNIRAIPQEGDIIYAREAPAGNAATIQKGEIVCLGQRTVLIRPLKGFVYSLLLTYFINAPLSRKSLISKAVGSTAAHVNMEVIRPFRIPLPPLQEQIRIVKEVERLFTIINSIEIEQIELENIISMMKSRVLELAISGKLVPQDPTDESAEVLLKRVNPNAVVSTDTSHYKFYIPNNWTISQLGSLFTHNTGKALNRSNREGTMLDYITTSNLYWDRFELEDLKQMPFKDSEIDKCTVIKGDLLVCEGGDIGRSAIWNYDYSICIQNHIHRLRPIDNHLVFPRFYYYCFLLYKHQNLIGGKGIGIQGLSSNQLHKVVFPLPPLNEQKRIVSKVDELFAVIDQIKQSLE